MSGEDQSLMDRVEMPNIPKDAQKKISHLQEEFIRAEVEQRMSNPLLSILFPSTPPCDLLRWEGHLHDVQIIQ